MTPNPSLLPEVHIGVERNGQAALPLAAEGVQRYVWESRFGAILIEVIGDKVFVNGGLVEPCLASAAGHAASAPTGE